MSFRFSNSFGSVVWFCRLWLAVALVMALLVFVEMAFLTASGYQYRPKEHVEKVTLRDMAIVDSPYRAGVFFFRRRDGDKPLLTKVRLYDGDRVPQSFHLEDVEPYRVALSVDRKLAISSTEGKVFLWQLPKPPLRLEKELRLPLFQMTDDPMLDCLTFSSNGQFLAANGEHEVFVWNTNSKERLDLPCKSGEQFLSFFSDSTRLLTTAQSGVLRIHDLAYADTHQDMQTGEDQIKAAAISPDSNTVLISNDAGELMAWSLNENRMLWKKYTTPLALRVALTNEHAAFVANNGVSVMICDAKSGESPRAVLQNDEQLIGLIFVGRELHAWDVSGRVSSIRLDADVTANARDTT